MVGPEREYAHRKIGSLRSDGGYRLAGRSLVEYDLEWIQREELAAADSLPFGPV